MLENKKMLIDTEISEEMLNKFITGVIYLISKYIFCVLLVSNFVLTFEN